MKLLEVKNLEMFYKVSRGWVRAVDNVSFDLELGDRLGIAGESGCGKTSLTTSILRLIPKNARIMGGRVLLRGTDLLSLSEDEMRKVRWKTISIIPQSAMNALNPVLRVGDQVKEALKTHEDVSVEEAEKRVSELFSIVGLDPSRKKYYPHEFSGGMRQRVLVAMSLVCRPELILADEPTTALDVLVQDQILEQIEALQREYGFSMILVSHDLAILAESCNKMIVMYGGKIVEYADTTELFKNPRHPYSICLLRSTPSIKGDLKTLSSLTGSPPSLFDPPPGCRFRPRCPIQKETCKELPPFVKVADGHYTLCHYADNEKIIQNVVVN